MGRMSVALIWAQAVGRVVGKDNTIPWRLPEDQQRFKKLTSGHRVVMGRATWESLPASVRPLPDRENVVLTSDTSYVAEGARVVTSLEEALAGTDETVFVIGGARVWAEALPLAHDLYVTDVDVEIEGG